MIKPTVCRVVEVYFRKPEDGGPVVDNTRPIAAPPNGVPLPALITYVHSDTMINVGGFDVNGIPFSLTSLELVQDGSFPNGGVVPDRYATWMDFQNGQAAKTEALERQVAEGA